MHNNSTIVVGGQQQCNRGWWTLTVQTWFMHNNSANVLTLSVTTSRRCITLWWTPPAQKQKALKTSHELLLLPAAHVSGVGVFWQKLRSWRVYLLQLALCSWCGWCDAGFQGRMVWCYRGYKTIWCDAGFQGHMVGCWVTRPYGMWHGVHRGAWKPEQHAWVACHLCA